MRGHNLCMNIEHYLTCLAPHRPNASSVREPVCLPRTWVFPNIRKPLEHVRQQNANAALIRMGFGGELVAHGMRSIARTAGAGHFPREILESALAHQKEDEIEAVYNRSDYLEQRRPLMQ